jgi:5-methyltetrahydrofolate--homocysteine methyltransferase
VSDFTVQQLHERLAQRPLLFDGGMGTQLIPAGLEPAACGVAWNLDRADTVEAIHRRYFDAGADIITTNTFQAGREALQMHELSDKVVDLNRAGAEVARRAVGDAGLVAADIGPFGGFLEPLGTTTPQELAELFGEQLRAMKEGGADLVVVETMSDTAEVTVAIKTARELGDWPIVSTYAFQMAGNDFVTMMGTDGASAIQSSIAAGADVVGANCGTSMDLDDYVRLAGQLVEAAGDVPVIVQPNAGSPEQTDGGLHYPATPEQMAEVARRLIDAGVKVLGGCCGTTPEHIAAMARVVRG